MGLGRSRVWRALFVAGGVLYFVGSFHHPRGMMSDMLVDPAWVPAHAAVFVGLAAMTVGLVAFRRSRPTSAALGRWLEVTIVLAVLETLEMGVHTIAYVDADALPRGALTAGFATPVLTVHMWLATLVYTPFAMALIGLVWVGQRERSLGSPWIGWIGILGAAAHGAVMWVVIVLEIGEAWFLFPVGALAFSLWFVLAGLWPTRQPDRHGLPEYRAVAGAVETG